MRCCQDGIPVMLCYFNKAKKDTPQQTTFDNFEGEWDRREGEGKGERKKEREKKWKRKRKRERERERERKKGTDSERV